jgi:hypothetical protein
MEILHSTTPSDANPRLIFSCHMDLLGLDLLGEFSDLGLRHLDLFQCLCLSLQQLI